METTTYIATIPSQHETTHRSERAAILALHAAERRTGLRGQVEMYEQSGTYTSRTVIYPRVGETHSK